MKKRALSLLLALTILVGLLSVCPISASAAVLGATPSNPISLSDGVWHTKLWYRGNDHLYCYNKIVIPSRGYITLTLEKPIDDEGEICSYDLELFNQNGEQVWTCDTNAQEDNFNTCYEYKVGLAAGTYYLRIDPSFYITSGYISTDYKFVFKKSDAWEIETNNTAAKATTISLNKEYHGVYADESYNSNYQDFFKFKLSANKSYRLYLSNIDKMDAGTVILDLLDPNQDDTNDVYLGYFKSIGNTFYLDFKAEMSGYYYLRFDNDGNDAGIEYTLMVEDKSAAPKITKQPTATTVTKGKTAKFTVTASGNGLKYQWQVKTPGNSWKNTTASGCKTKTLSVKAETSRNGYQYRCIITNSYGNKTTSKAAKLTVREVEITKSPSSAKVTLGSTKKFTVTATGTGLKYQWQVKGPNSSWANTKSTGYNSAFENGKDIIPVKLEVKEFIDKPNRLYVAVALEGIKKDRVVSVGVPNNRSHVRTSPVTISIHELFSKINPLDVDFLKYIPNGFLNAEQKDKVSAKLDADYMKAVEGGNMEKVHGMVANAAKSWGADSENGKPVKFSHGTKNEDFTVPRR